MLTFENTFFKSAEQAYQHAKYTFFNKHEAAEQIMSIPSAKIAKPLRKICGKHTTWILR